MMKIPEDSELAEDLRETRKAAGVARDLVRQILAFSRHDPGNPAPVEVHIVVKEVLKLLRSSIPTTIEIRQNIDPHGGYVLTNPTQIHQILMNLCINAHHAMQKTGGILGVVLVPLEISSRDFIKNINLKPGPYLRLEISDTGMGMDSATLNRIFEPYFTTHQASDSTSPQSVGVVPGPPPCNHAAGYPSSKAAPACRCRSSHLHHHIAKNDPANAADAPSPLCMPPLPLNLPSRKSRLVRTVAVKAHQGLIFAHFGVSPGLTDLVN